MAYFSHKVKRKIRNVKKNIKIIYKTILHKGQEHQTVLFIPHSESRVFSFTISIFALFFLIILIIGISIFGILAANNSDDLKQSQKKAMDQRNKHLQNVIDLVSRVEPLEKHVSILKAEIDRMKTLSSIAKPGNLSQDSLIEKINIFEKELQQSSEGLQETFNLQRIQNDIINMKSKIKGISSTLNNLRELFKVIPSYYPVRGGGFVTSGYGYRRDPFTYAGSFHEGIDVILHPGAYILAGADGTVRHAEYGGGRGLYVEINHKYGFSTLYLHLATIKTYPQALVKKGDIIGTLGSTGRSTGPHLHYEVRINNIPVDPSPYMNFKGFSQNN